LAGNKDVEVNGSQSAAKAVFLQNSIDSARQGDVGASQYWHKLAALAAQSGNHLYPLT
jgi:hypothetical protein